MARFVVDENMPRSTASVLRIAGYEADDVRDVGLGSAPDSVIFAFAQERSAVLITGDRDFGSVGRYPLGTHAGIVIVRGLNKLSRTVAIREVMRTVAALADENLEGCLVTVELNLRTDLNLTTIRRPPPE